MWMPNNISHFKLGKHLWFVSMCSSERGESDVRIGLLRGIMLPVVPSAQTRLRNEEWNVKLEVSVRLDCEWMHCVSSLMLQWHCPAALEKQGGALNNVTWYERLGFKAWPYSLCVNIQVNSSVYHTKHFYLFYTFKKRNSRLRVSRLITYCLLIHTVCIFGVS